MLKKDITFEGLDGSMITETHYFHMSKADLIELQLSKKGGFEVWLQKVIDAEDGATLIRELKDIILMAYGEKSEDGKRFIKSPEKRAEFANSEAFSELFSEIAIDADKASEFVNAVMPAGLLAETRQQMNVFDQGEDQPKETAISSPPKQEGVETELVSPPAPVREVITQAEAREMPAEELQRKIAEGAVISS